MQISKVATAVALSTGLLFGCNSDGLPVPTDPVAPSPELKITSGYWQLGTAASAASFSTTGTDLPNVYVFSEDGNHKYYDDDATPGTYVIKDASASTNDYDEDAGTVTQRGAEARRAGKAGEPRQAFVARGDIFALMGIGAGDQEAVIAVFLQLRAQGGKPVRALLGACGDVEGLEHLSLLNAEPGPERRAAGKNVGHRCCRSGGRVTARGDRELFCYRSRLRRQAHAT